ncbi:uncharacterized protein LOC125062006 [Pieris napi]|uniref:uncharacterized protein LOC125062006 n=1 Tax=Pieris napi TaxID=78633 RepID=UPI001FB972E7|nr:uncharacterized protein LOC125062006 [Pieris napi]
MMLEIYYQNVQGLRTKTASFLKYLSTSNYKIIALTETWLKSGISNMELFDNRYTVYRRDRSSSTNTKSDGGGVILGVSKEISSFRVEAWESDVEDLWVTLQININKIIKKLSICVVYLPPPVKIGTLTHFLDSVDRALNLSDDVIILGDFNLGFINWRSLNNEVFMTPYNYNNTLGFAFIDFMSMNSLKQFNSIGNSDDRFLDLVLSNMSSINVSAPSDSLSKIYANPPSLLLTIEYSKISFLRTRGNTKLNFYKADYVSIIGDLKTIDWNDSLRAHDDVNDMVSEFYKILNTTISKFVPKTTIKKSKYPVWFSSSLIKLLAEKEKTRKRYRKRCHKLYDDCYTKYKLNIELNIIDVKLQVPKERRLKWDKKANKLIFVGYAEKTKGYRVYDPVTNIVTISRDVVVMESPNQNMVEIPLECKHPVQVTEQENDYEEIESSSFKDDCGDETYIPESEVSVSTSSDKTFDTVSDPGVEPIEPEQLPKRTRVRPDRYGYNNFCMVECEDSSQGEITLGEALNGPESQFWRASMKEELKSFRENEAWEVVDRPKQATVGEQSVKTKEGNLWVETIS